METRPRARRAWRTRRGRPLRERGRSRAPGARGADRPGEDGRPLAGGAARQAPLPDPGCAAGEPERSRLGLWPGRSATPPARRRGRRFRRGPARCVRRPARFLVREPTRHRDPPARPEAPRPPDRLSPRREPPSRAAPRRPLQRNGRTCPRRLQRRERRRPPSRLGPQSHSVRARRPGMTWPRAGLRPGRRGGRRREVARSPPRAAPSAWRTLRWRGAVAAAPEDRAASGPWTPIRSRSPRQRGWRRPWLPERPDRRPGSLGRRGALCRVCRARSAARRPRPRRRTRGPGRQGPRCPASPARPLQAGRPHR